MKLVTWNVNSVRARGERLVAMLARDTPDIVCLQELKVTDENFPSVALKEMGYHAAVFGQRAYNGVAILARQPLTEIVCGLGDVEEAAQARVIAATVGDLRVMSVYVPNGSKVDSDKFVYKMQWFKRLRGLLQKSYRPTDKLVVAGDFNVAPRACDVANPDAWEHTVLCHPQARGALQDLADWGLYDVCAEKFADGGVYSWWDYRMLGFVKNDGLRIDLIYTTASLVPAVIDAGVDRNERKGKLPSDHAPVWVTLDMSASA